MGKSKATTIILVILLILALGYIGSGLYKDMKQKKELSVFQQGAQYGYEQAIMSVIQQAVTCQAVPLIVGNQTVNMIAVDCLKQE